MVSEFGLPASYSPPSALTAGPDGNLWFATRQAIGRITPTGTISEYPISNVVGDISTLTVGPDGNLWFSEGRGPGVLGHFGYYPGTPAEIGRITPAGSITEFPLAPDLSPYYLSALTVGPDKNLYFTFGALDIGRITTSGTVVEFAGTVPSSSPAGPFNTYAPTAGSDGNLWFPDGPNIGRLETALATPGQAISPMIRMDYPFQPSLNRSKGAITSVVLTFDEAMNSASTGTRSFYSVAAGVNKHHMVVYTRILKIRSVTYDPTAETATLKLASPVKAKQLQVTVHSGVMAANGTVTVGDATAIAS
jgi:hypothetical protein